MEYRPIQTSCRQRHCVNSYIDEWERRLNCRSQRHEADSKTHCHIYSAFSSLPSAQINGCSGRPSCCEVRCDVFGPTRAASQSISCLRRTSVFVLARLSFRARMVAEALIFTLAITGSNYASLQPRISTFRLRDGCGPHQQQSGLSMRERALLRKTHVAAFAY